MMRNVILKLALIFAISFPFTASAYTPPVGIPSPALGFGLGNGIDVQPPANPSGWPSSEVAGYYYVDNTSTCTPTGYGYPNMPRCSIPTTLTAGSVVEVHGGPYPNHLTLTLNGTDESPIFIYGVGSPVLSGGTTDLQVSITGSYFVIDNINTIGGRVRPNPVSNCVIRNSIINGNSTTTQLGLVPGGHDIVLFNNEVHHHQRDDKHGITIPQGSSNIWVLNNRLHHNGGDGLQFCHGCSAAPPHHIYIGDNVAYSNRENGFDFKYGQYIVLSQNEVYGHVKSLQDVTFCFDDSINCTPGLGACLEGSDGCVVGSSGSDGSGIVVGSDGATRDIWVINNNVYDNGNGIRVEEAWDTHIVGNNIHDVPLNRGIQLEKCGEGPVTMANNTITNVKTGIEGPWQTGELITTISNNIISNCSGDWVKYLNNNSRNTVQVTDNLFHNTSGVGTITDNPSVGSVSHTTGATIDTQMSGTGNVVDSPDFISESNFHIQTTSPAKDTGTVQSLYTAFFAMFGVSMETDISGTPRPQNSLWDKGAYEYDVGYVPPVYDTTKPTVTAFTIPSTSSSLTVSNIILTAADNTAVTGYQITESSTAPVAGGANWRVVAPSTYTCATQGSKTLYAWAIDGAGNVSSSMSASVTITVVAPPVGQGQARLQGAGHAKMDGPGHAVLGN